MLTDSPGVSDTDFLSENLGFWPNLVQVVSITLKVTTAQNEPLFVPLVATRGRSFFYYMKNECCKLDIYEWVKKTCLGGLKGGPKGVQKDAKKIGSGTFSILQGPWKVFYHLVSAWPRGECAHSDFFLTLSISQNMFIFHGKNAKSLGWSQICMKTGSTNFGHFWTWKIHCFVDVFKTMGVSRYSKLVVI